jgi:hypothetical protein
MKFRNNYSYRYLDFIYPVEATTAVFKVIEHAINSDWAYRSVMSGPAPLKEFSRRSMELNQKIMMIEEAHADDFIAALRKAVKPFEPADQSVYKTIAKAR